jgi:KaiC/GvpD/RAD55 family RecA-like ATPase
MAKLARKKQKGKAPAIGQKKETKFAKTPAAALFGTGIPALDKMLGGGIPEGTSTILYGTPHCGKKPLLMKIAYAAMKRNRPVIFILTDFGITNWVNMMASSGWNIEKFEENCYAIDCYSQQFGACPTGETVKCMEVPYTLSQISIAVTDFIDAIKQKGRKKPVVIIHSLSTLIENFDEDSVFKFMQFFIGKLRTDGIPLVCSLQSGVHGSKTTTLLTSLVDGIIEMEDRKIRASGFRGAMYGWLEYGLAKDGISIKLPELKTKKK